MAKDDWLSSAMTDDVVVVELLLRLKHSLASPSHLLIPLTWGLKQPRSRPSPFRFQLLSHRANKLDSTRCSPSTPLSLTGRLSSSPTSDASEDSTPTNFSLPSAGSKDTVINESAAATTPTSNSKRSRKKKTLAELKIEEGLPSDDRAQFGKELSSLHGLIKEYTPDNESFKRVKLNLNLKSSNAFSCIADGREESCGKTNDHINQSLLMHATATGNDGGRAGNNNVHGGDDFLLPDLNMMPSEIEKCECF